MTKDNLSNIKRLLMITVLMHLLACSHPVASPATYSDKVIYTKALETNTTQTGTFIKIADSNTVPESSYMHYPKMKRFIKRMSEKHHFDTQWLFQLFSVIKRDNDILRRVNTPAEAKPWKQYRPIFMTDERVDQGIGFWKHHSQDLQRASSHFNVPIEYIVAIIGVETSYGKNTGKHYVLPSLTTLAMDFAKREKFYTSELEQYLLLTREENINPHRLKGSYAGAMGLGQFISSSYRNFALDFNQDGKRDLWHPQDAIGSVANYLAKHGWKPDQNIATPARITGQAYQSLIETRAKKPKLTLQQLHQSGIRPLEPLYSKHYSLLHLAGRQGDEFWVTSDNFYTITRYNHSPKYAMAVHQLAQTIKHYYHKQK